MKYLSVCSGIEAASVAWHDFGWEPIGFAEIEPFPSAVLAHRFPNVKNYGDITKYKEWDIRPGTVDVLVGGPPCQAFSCAGLRAGLADPRGNLTLVYVGMVDHFKPRWVLYENVPGLLSSNGGRDFSAFVKALADIGYGVCWRMLDAQHFGVPQRRRRLYLVGYPGNWRPPAAVLFESHRLCGDSSQGKEKGEDIASASGASVDKGCWWDGGQVSQTLDAVLAKGQTMPEKSRFPAVLQPKPIVIDRAAFNQGKNAQYDIRIEETETMDTLVAKGPHAVAQPSIAFKVRGGGEYSGTKGGEVKPNEHGGTGMLSYVEKTFTLAATQDQYLAHPVRTPSSEIAPTITSSGPPYSRTSNERVETEALVTVQKEYHIASQPGNLVSRAGAEPSTEVFPTLKCDAGDQSPQVAYPAAAAFKSGQGSAARSIGWNENVSPTLPANAGGNTAPAVIGTMTAMVVRRITPLEAERLQGFPDNWTRIPWRGKAEEDCPDGPRYKACGNSMATPVMRWIGLRIAFVDSVLQSKVCQDTSASSHTPSTSEPS